MDSVDFSVSLGWNVVGTTTFAALVRPRRSCSYGEVRVLSASVPDRGGDGGGGGGGRGGVNCVLLIALGGSLGGKLI